MRYSVQLEFKVFSDVEADSIAEAEEKILEDIYDRIHDIVIDIDEAKVIYTIEHENEDDYAY